MRQIVSIGRAYDVHLGDLYHNPILAEAEIGAQVLNKDEASLQ
jgi:hypothetical protein